MTSTRGTRYQHTGITIMIKFHSLVYMQWYICIFYFRLLP